MDWEDEAFLEDEFPDILEEEDEEVEVTQFTNPTSNFTHEVGPLIEMVYQSCSEVLPTK